MDKKLTDKLGLVVGRGSGIGWVCTMVFAQSRAAILVSNINLSAAQ
ncbi:MAG: hypothetical protein WCY88_15275 [Spongiibacteraceae bacterium]